jgi:hypothetical protein
MLNYSVSYGSGACIVNSLVGDKARSVDKKAESADLGRAAAMAATVGRVRSPALLSIQRERFPVVLQGRGP